MSTDAAYRIFPFRARASSGDVQRGFDLGARLTQEAANALGAQDRAESGVIRGLDVTIDAGARTATVAVGVGIMYDASEAYPDSPYRWVEVHSPITVPIAAGSGFARWDVIEIEPNSAVTINQTTDVWDSSVPPNGAFVPEARDRERQSVPIVTPRSGADNSPNPPNFPSGASGRLPLAYVYVDAAGVVSGGKDGIVECRPLLWPMGLGDPSESYGPFANDTGQPYAEGGGIHVSASDPATSNSTIDIVLCRGRFANQRQWFTTGYTSTIDLSDAFSWQGGVVEGIDRACYVWAFDAPYPAGYDAMAGREFVVGSAVNVHFTCVPSGNTDQRNCGLIVSGLRDPNSAFEFGTPAGSGGGTTMTLADWPFRNGTTQHALVPRECVYVGAFDWDAANVGAMRQQYKGGGRVNLTGRYCSTNILAQGAGGVDHLINIREPDNGFGAWAQGHLPTTAYHMACLVEYSAGAPGSWSDNIVTLRDQANEDLFLSSVQQKQLSWPQSSAAGTFTIQGHPIDLDISDDSLASNNVVARYERSDGNVFTCNLHVTGYIDKILAMR